MKKFLLLIASCWIAVALFIQLSVVILSFIHPEKADEIGRKMLHKMEGSSSN
jgi:hypothetical protein